MPPHESRAVITLDYSIRGCLYADAVQVLCRTANSISAVYQDKSSKTARLMLHGCTELQPTTVAELEAISVRVLLFTRVRDDASVWEYFPELKPKWRDRAREIIEAIAPVVLFGAIIATMGCGIWHAPTWLHAMQVLAVPAAYVANYS